MKYYSIALLSSLLTSTLFAAPIDKRGVVEELVQKLEAFDPNIKSHQDDWSKVRSHLEQAAQQSESAAGLKLSVQHILDQWGGLRFRILDRDDAQYWALNGQEISLPKAWFTARGAKWIVQYSENAKLRRGDSISSGEFSPFSKGVTIAEIVDFADSIETPAAPVTQTLDLQRQPLSQWAIDLTQASSTSVIVDNKRICVEKVWFWLNPTVSTNIASKLSSADTTCQALLIDLRDTFGEGINSWPKIKSKIPIAVLINRNTREGAVTLARMLKVDSKAVTFGEDTDSDRAAQSKDSLKKYDWTVVITGDGGMLEANNMARDSFLNAEGLDEVKEAGMGWIRKELSR